MHRMILSHVMKFSRITWLYSSNWDGSSATAALQQQHLLWDTSLAKPAHNVNTIHTYITLVGYTRTGDCIRAWRSGQVCRPHHSIWGKPRRGRFNIGGFTGGAEWRRVNWQDSACCSHYSNWFRYVELARVVPRVCIMYIVYTIYTLACNTMLYLACLFIIPWQARDEEVEFAHGEITKTIHIPLMDDDVFNEDKIFEVMLSDATAGATLGKSKCTIVTILNDDGKILEWYQFSRHSTDWISVPFLLEVYALFLSVSLFPLFYIFLLGLSANIKGYYISILRVSIKQIIPLKKMFSVNLLCLAPTFH